MRYFQGRNYKDCHISMDCLITRVCTTDIRTVYHCHGGVLEKVTRHGIPQGFSEVKTHLENQIDRTV